MQAADAIRLFAYGSWREGERAHSDLAGARRIGTASTLPDYLLVDLGVYAAMVEGGRLSVVGELYAVDRELRRQLDVLAQCPILFHRRKVELVGGESAEAYLMRQEQVRGRRRLHVGDWKQRFLPRFGRRR